MAYKIEYSPVFSNKYPDGRKSVKLWKGILAMSMLVLTATVLLNRNARDYVKEILIPGEAETTVAAAEIMVRDLKEGASLADAVSAFCMEILERSNAH